jgi:alkanesulfonate monooxygenase SsuD/methylene tetrahydromethanopterin reductase-like flavin-dependent oxidoreductase (luciferase family)
MRVGVPFAGRGARTEEYLAAMRAIRTQPHPSYKGDLISFDKTSACWRSRSRCWAIPMWLPRRSTRTSVSTG